MKVEIKYRPVNKKAFWYRDKKYISFKTGGATNRKSKRKMGERYE